MNDSLWKLIGFLGVNVSGIFHILQEELMHFFCSGLAGVLAYYLTSTILRAFAKFSLKERFQQFIVVDRIITLVSLWVMLALAWRLHVSLDSFVIWLNTPLAPPLTIIK